MLQINHWVPTIVDRNKADGEAVEIDKFVTQGNTYYAEIGGAMYQCNYFDQNKRCFREIKIELQ